MIARFPSQVWPLLAVGAVACGGPQKLGEAGAKCFRDDDCVAGLICVAPVGKTVRVCSNDPTPIVSMVEGPPIAEGGTAGAAVTAGAATGGAAIAGAQSAGSANGGAAVTAGSGGTGASSTAGTDPGSAGTGGSVATDGGAPP